MRHLRVLAPAALAVAALFGVASARERPVAMPNDAAVPSAARTIEIRRIRVHFDSVLAELEGRDVAFLDATQRAQRTALLATLRSYRDRGVFPYNYDFPRDTVPYFVDRKTGTLCAVAYLLASTGRSDIVARAAFADNNVRVAQLSGDTAFASWLDAHGLTLAEAARIQVPYVQTPPTVARGRSSTPAALPLATGASALAGAWNAFANADGHSRLANVLGLGSGVVAIGVGASQLQRDGVSRTMSVTTAVVGGLSVALSARSLHRHNVLAAAERDAARKSTIADATIAPILPVGGGGAGISVSMRF